MDAKTYIGITPERFGQICLTAKAETGIDIQAVPQGQASGNGVTISWDYDRDANTLVIQCLKKPWYYPESAIIQRLNDLVAGAQIGAI